MTKTHAAAAAAALAFTAGTGWADIVSDPVDINASPSGSRFWFDGLHQRGPADVGLGHRRGFGPAGNHGHVTAVSRPISRRSHPLALAGLSFGGSRLGKTC
jgi:hypothetical protein